MMSESFDVEKIVLEGNGFSSFNEMQKKALEKEIFTKSTVVSAPTASGKTIILELSALHSILNEHKKVIYTCPLRALASEHFRDFKRKYSKKFGIRVALSIGDFDSSSAYLSGYDIVFSTQEKLDSLLRHRAEWLSQVGLLVVDEVHELDSDRGPTLEMAVTKMRFVSPSLKIIALSATIPNAKEIAKWLSAQLVESTFRPVELVEGVYFNGTFEYGKGKEKIPLKKDALESIVTDTLGKQKQALVFAMTRKQSEATARKAAVFTQKLLTEKEKTVLAKGAERLKKVLEQPTSQCMTLASTVEKGASFHHAGLLQKQREIIEDLFREGSIKIICATPTLCLVPEANIWAGVTQERVDAFNIHKQLLALKGKKLVKVRPDAIIPRKNRKKIVTLYSVSGYELKLTENHEVLIKRSGKPVLIPAGKCKKGDKIATVGKILQKNTKNLTVGNIVSNSPVSSKLLTKAMFYFIGAMLGDGYSGVEKNSGGLRFKANPCLVGKDSEIFDIAKNVCNDLGISFRSTKNFYGVPSLVLGKNKWFREFLLNCGVDKGDKKFISNNLMFAGQPFISSLLQGLFDTDGCVERKGNISFSNISTSLIKNIQRLLLLFGIVSRVRKRKASTMTIFDKTYNTKKYFELSITQKKSILIFASEIGFNVKRKQRLLSKIVSSINTNIRYVECNECSYRLFKDLFSGRTQAHKLWGNQKLLVLKELAKNGAKTSKQLSEALGFIPYKKERRLNHHFELITRSRIGNKVVWNLNSIGAFLYKKGFMNSKNFKLLFNISNCPICKESWAIKLRNGWRENDFEGNIFWDILRSVKKETSKKYPLVYDVVLPSNGSSDHLFVAEGFIVHNSAGVNTPAFRVVIPSLYRYTELGSQRIPVREYKQMSGRAGRPAYDTRGESILFARSEIEADELFQAYVNGEVEEVSSKLGIEPVLRTHLLGIIATGYAFDLSSLEQFFSKTFYFTQFGNDASFYQKVTSLLKELEEMGFVQSNAKRISATPIGVRVSELYLDPVSAYSMIGFLKKKRYEELAYLYSFVNTSEMSPFFSIPKKLEANVWAELEEKKSLLGVDVDREMFLDAHLLKKFNTALIFKEWVNEAAEEKISEDYGIQPGIMHSKKQIAEWMAYSEFELSKALGLNEHLAPLLRLQKRIKQGIKEELLQLVELRGIGRVRARRLFRAGIKTLADVKKTDVQDLAKIIPPIVAQKVKEQLKQ